MAIYDVLKLVTAEVSTIALGISASTACIILAGGTKAESTGRSFEHVQKDIDRDRYMSPIEVVEYGVIDGVIDEDSVIPLLPVPDLVKPALSYDAITQNPEKLLNPNIPDDEITTVEHLHRTPTPLREESDRLIEIIRSRVLDCLMGEGGDAGPSTIRNSTYDGTPNIRSQAIMEAKKWVEENKEPESATNTEHLKEVVYSTCYSPNVGNNMGMINSGSPGSGGTLPSEGKKNQHEVVETEAQEKHVYVQVPAVARYDLRKRT
ncbi:hypothetical protein CTI12_AA611680 [Artemisia annua]|uniref:ATP-dependent Clp protease proteolytic subunit n=1 Tax=Artemisia annua TaxID=35608 RepID=A0A2U1KC40_ARTAN|nr:hypothetical protein CTI12_AA611680 [Artemisia annua]